LDVILFLYSKTASTNSLENGRAFGYAKNERREKRFLAARAEVSVTVIWPMN